LNVALLIAQEKIDSVVVKEMGPISFYTLRDNIIDVYLSGDGIVKEIAKKLSKNELRLLKEPTKKKL